VFAAPTVCTTEEREANIGSTSRLRGIVSDSPRQPESQVLMKAPRLPSITSTAE
jgi:hypothetical protein